MMHYPDFYSQVPPITLYDPLSEMLGAFEDGLIDISYLDCVKLAGHSCPTVAGAYLMASKGLKGLYGENIPPHRGSIKVEVRASEKEGSVGVIANVLSFITGAGGEGGFKGIQGNFSRNNLLCYNTPMQGEIRLTRLDTHKNITLSYDPSIVAPDPMMQPLMEKFLKGIATKNEKNIFRELWQNRVKKILLSSHAHKNIITII